jgi:hypothetical protein
MSSAEDGKLRTRGQVFAWLISDVVFTITMIYLSQRQTPLDPGFCYAALHYGQAAICGVIIIILGIMLTGKLFLHRRKSGHLVKMNLYIIQ